MEMEQVKQNEGVSTISLLAKNLPKIHIGQYWYDDDTCSDDLLEGKSLKAVIVLIRGQDIYGDIFSEQNASAQDVYKFFPVRNFNLEKNCIVADIREMELLADEICVVNKALEKAKKPLWQGYYWTDSDCGCYETWIKVFPEGKTKRSERRGNYKLRPLIRKQVL
ncbi:MAG: hypothetical protein IJ545_08220 [Alphaproteobacteria bacterium]|nr:hypothetical protein [Alphaproteobacteria bacterium]